MAQLRAFVAAAARAERQQRAGMAVAMRLAMTPDQAAWAQYLKENLHG
ncbi:hypothetical protein [Stenotrophomonas lacuserhaii]|nr:hypothetical protein [Stenotrophomonas lacuserhaii]